MVFYQYPMFFTSRFDHNLDIKLRLSLPAEFRQAMSPADAGTFFATWGDKPCLHLYPKNFWAQYIYANWNPYYTVGSPSEEYNQQALKRQMVTEIVTMDPQGRITLSKNHLNYASISKEVAIIGDNFRIQLWNPAKLDEYMSKVKPLPLDFQKMDPNSENVRRTVQMNPYQPGFATPLPTPEQGAVPPIIPPNQYNYPQQSYPPGQQYYPNQTPQPNYPNAPQPGFPGSPGGMNYPNYPPTPPADGVKEK